jgi:hypothetical protein
VPPDGVVHDDERERLRRLYAERVAEQDRDHPGYGAAWGRFADELLAHGGTHVVPPLQPDRLIEVLRAEGHLRGATTEVEPGLPSACHRNAVEIWRAGRAGAIGTGYALSDDGLWREHSWGVAPDGAVIETTEPRLRYFGVTMEGERAEWFARWVGPA